MNWNIAMLLAWSWIVPSLVWATSPKISPEAWARYERLCRDEVHVQCIRQGIQWLQQDDTPTAKKVLIYAYMAVAHLALDQKEQAQATLVRMVHLAPCQSEPPVTLPPDVLKFYHYTRREVLHNDQAPPVITHIPPTLQQFRDAGTFVAKVTENLGLRQVMLYYRIHAAAPYQNLSFAGIGRDQFRVQIPSSLHKQATFFQYYIEAEDCATRIARAQSGPKEPFQIFLQSQGTSARTIGGSLLISVGAALVISSVFLFLSANSELERWKATDDIAKSEEIRGSILMFHGFGWGGLSLGIGSLVAGTILVVRPSSPPSTAVAQRFSGYSDPLSKEVHHATRVRVSSTQSGPVSGGVFFVGK